MMNNLDTILKDLIKHTEHFAIVWNPEEGVWFVTSDKKERIFDGIENVREFLIIEGLKKEIVETVKHTLKLDDKRFYSTTRKRGEADGRFLCMYIIKKIYPKLPNRIIAKVFNLSSHDSINHAIIQVESVREVSLKLKYLLDTYPKFRRVLK